MKLNVTWLKNAMFLFTLLLAGSTTVLGQAPAPCCSVATINASTGVVAAKANATGAPFEFKVPNARMVAAGQPVYANFATKQVSLDGKTICCTIITDARPGVLAPGSARTSPCPPPASCPPHSICQGTNVFTASGCSGTRVSACEAGYFGAHCYPCPGAPNGVCSNHGACSEGQVGTGACTCNPGFSGVACSAQAP